jgi:hypothetical protein
MGPALGSALHHHAGTVRGAASAALWAAWVVGVVATLVAHPVGLTTLRCLAPAAVGAAVAAVLEGHGSAVAVAVAMVSAAIASAIVFVPATARWCVNGPAYGSERRYPLAVPGAVLLGPLEIAWIAVVGLPSAALVLLAGGAWLAGGLCGAASVPALALFPRALHGLSQRWVVFVPAGVVLHDPLTLVDAVLFPRPVIERLGPAPAGSDALDLTQNAPGLALELVLRAPVPLVLAGRGRRPAQPGASSRLLFTPTRPGAVLREARARRLPVARPPGQAAHPPPNTAVPDSAS